MFKRFNGRFDSNAYVWEGWDFLRNNVNILRIILRMFRNFSWNHKKLVWILMTKISWIVTMFVYQQETLLFFAAMFFTLFRRRHITVMCLRCMRYASRHLCVVNDFQFFKWVVKSFYLGLHLRLSTAWVNPPSPHVLLLQSYI